MQTRNSIIITKAQASFTELLDDREAIILDLENLHYYTLNAAAILLWKNLRSGAAQTAEELTAVLATAFRLNASAAAPDVQAWLTEMTRNGLLSFTTTRTTASAPLYVAGTDWPTYEAPQLKLSNSLTEVVLSGSAVVGPAAITGGG